MRDLRRPPRHRAAVASIKAPLTRFDFCSRHHFVAAPRERVGDAAEEAHGLSKASADVVVVAPDPAHRVAALAVVARGRKRASVAASRRAAASSLGDRNLSTTTRPRRVSVSAFAALSASGAKAQAAAGSASPMAVRPYASASMPAQPAGTASARHASQLGIRRSVWRQNRAMVTRVALQLAL